MSYVAKDISPTFSFFCGREETGTDAVLSLRKSVAIPAPANKTEETMEQTAPGPMLVVQYVHKCIHVQKLLQMSEARPTSMRSEQIPVRM